MLHEGEGTAVHRHRLRGLDPRPDRPGLPLPADQQDDRDLTLDVGGVGSRGGEFIAGQLQAAVDRESITHAAIDEIAGLRRGPALLAGVLLRRRACDPRRRGTPRARRLSCATIFGDTPSAERDRIIAAFKRGEIRALASMGVLTTGFNAPAVDLIAMLRPDQVDRALRADGRPRHAARARQGELPGARLRRQRRPARADRCREAEARPSGRPTARRRPPRSARTATASWPRPSASVPTADTSSRRPRSRSPPPPRTLAILSTGQPQWVEVSEVSYRRHEKPGKPPSLRVDYSCGLVRHSEWICFEHTGYARAEGGRLVAARAAPRRCRRPSPRRWTRAAAWRRRPPYRCGRAVASPRSSITGSTHAPIRPLRRLPPRAPRLRLVRCRAIASATPDATPATDSSAPASARTSAIGGRGMIDPTPNERAAMAARRRRWPASISTASARPTSRSSASRSGTR